MSQYPDQYIVCDTNNVRIPLTALGSDQVIQMERAKQIAKACCITYKPPGPNGARRISRITCSVYNKAKNCIVVPRFAFSMMQAQKIADVDQLQCKYCPSKIIEPAILQFTATLNPDQSHIYEWLMRRVYNAEQRATCFASCVLKLEAGRGKTFLATAIACQFRQRFAVVIHSRSMLSQWEDFLRQYIPAAKIGYYYSDRKSWGDIMLVVSDSAANSHFTIDKVTYTAKYFYSTIGFIIFDECHVYCNVSGVSMFMNAATPSIGLSATPDEHSKGFDRVATWFLGPIVDAQLILDQYNTTQATAERITFKGQVFRCLYYGSPAYTRRILNHSGESDFVGNITQICQDPDRDPLIIAAVCDGLSHGLNMFVFADRRDYLERLRQALELNNIAAGILDEQGFAYRVVGGTTPEEMREAEKNARVILTTYEYMGTGRSIPHMNGLVLATPRKGKMEQYIKRIFRLGSDHTIVRRIYDIVDKLISVQTQWYTRATYYKEREFEITDMKFSDELLDSIRKNIEQQAAPV